MSAVTEHLRSLLAAASARPWRSDAWSAHGGDIWDSPDPGTIDKVASVHCGGKCGTGPANLGLIVSAINALPQLLACVEAAEAWRDAECADWVDRTNRDTRLRAALDTLGGKP